MRRWISFVACFYPRQWRDEFGPEFDALIEDVKPSWRVFRNVLGGAVRMQITEGGNWMKLAGTMAVVGALVAFGISFRVAPQYVSSATVSVTPQVDPVRPALGEALHQRAAASVAEMEAAILSRFSLFQVIDDPGLLLYPEERQRKPLDDIIAEMRRNIHIEVRPSAGGDLAPIVFSISFSYLDQAKAQAVVRALATKFNQENENVNRVRTQYYRDFWQDITQFEHAKPAPPPPVGETVGVVSNASLPVELAPNRAEFLVWGLGAGLVVGLLAVFAVGRPRALRRMCGWALAGALVACGVSFLLPNRFTSTATMTLAPPKLTEDPTAPLPPAMPAAEYLRQIEPELLSVPSLSKVIEFPRLNLYPEERRKMSIEDVVQKMSGNLSIVPVDSAFAPGRTVSAFRVSFTYSDRYKAQLAVNGVMNAIEDQRQKRANAEAQHMSEVVRQITQRKGGEVLEVVDTASLPIAPVSPNRLAMSLAGMGAGLLIGLIRLRGKPAGATIPQFA